ncbi:hypothetical protein PO909_029558 [Leuciscus waleckii]
MERQRVFSIPKAMMFCARECFLLLRACTAFCTGSLYGVMRQIGALKQGHPPSPRMHFPAGGNRRAVYTGLFFSTLASCTDPGYPTKMSKELPLVVSDGLQLYRIKQLPVEVALDLTCWWFDADVTAIYCTSYYTAS